MRWASNTFRFIIYCHYINLCLRRNLSYDSAISNRLLNVDIWYRQINSRSPNFHFGQGLPFWISVNVHFPQIEGVTVHYWLLGVFDNWHRNLLLTAFRWILLLGLVLRGVSWLCLLQEVLLGMWSDLWSRSSAYELLDLLPVLAIKLKTLIRKASTFQKFLVFFLSPPSVVLGFALNKIVHVSNLLEWNLNYKFTMIFSSI